MAPSLAFQWVWILPLHVLAAQPWSLPVKGTDATRVEALGPTLAALLVTTDLPLGRVAFFGDSAYVVNLLAATTILSNLYLFNCRELTRDLLSDRDFTTTWISWD